MSFRVTLLIRSQLYAIRKAHYTAAHLVVLLALADRANNSGECWPGIETLASDAWLSPRWVRRVIADLEQDGLLETTRSSGRGNRYRLCLNPGTEDRGVENPGTIDPGTQYPTPRHSEPHTGVVATPHPGTEYPLTSQEQVNESVKETVQSGSVSTNSNSVQNKVATAPVAVTEHEEAEQRAAAQLTDTLIQLLGSPAPLEKETKRKWLEQASKALLLVPDIETVTKALRWVFSANDSGDEKKNSATFWFNRITEADWPMARIAKSADKIVRAAATAENRKQRGDPQKNVPPSKPAPNNYYARKMMSKSK